MPEGLLFHPDSSTYQQRQQAETSRQTDSKMALHSQQHLELLKTVHATIEHVIAVHVTMLHHVATVPVQYEYYRDMTCGSY